jgi:uncharacterized protein (TIGR00369 family)
MIINQEVLKKITNLDGQTCFGCGANNAIGLHMEFLTDDQRVYSFVTVPEAMAGWDQTVHGGIISTMLDEIMGWTVIYLLKKIGVTKTMTVEFMKPLSVGKRLTVIGAIQEIQSERQVLVTGEIYSDEETLCAKAQGTFAAMSAQTAVRLGVMRDQYMRGFLPILHQKVEE